MEKHWAAGNPKRSGDVEVDTAIGDEPNSQFPRPRQCHIRQWNRASSIKKASWRANYVISANINQFCLFCENFQTVAYIFTQILSFFACTFRQHSKTCKNTNAWLCRQTQTQIGNRKHFYWFAYNDAEMGPVKFAWISQTLSADFPQIWQYFQKIVMLRGRPFGCVIWLIKNSLLPVSFRQPCTKHPADDVTLSNSPPTCSPLSPSITHSLFHSRLKTHLFHKSFPP